MLMKKVIFAASDSFIHKNKQTLLGSKPETQALKFTIINTIYLITLRRKQET